MNRKMWAAGLLLVSTGCTSMNNTESGAIGGGLIGGALGTVVGLAARNPLAGAAIGAGVGAGVGALAGNQEDRREQAFKDHIEVAAAVSQENAARAPKLEEIVSMSKNGVADGVIINQIRSCNVVYKLNTDDINYLTTNGVSGAVINSMQTAVPYYANGVYVRPAVYGGYYDPPPVGVGVGFGYGYGRRW
jgi:Glycine zipper